MPTSHLTSLGRLFREQATSHPDRPFLWSRRDSEWVSWSWSEVDARVRALAAALIDAGLEAGDRVAILSENRPEWLVADLACLSIGVVDVPVYATSPSTEVHHVLRDSGSRLVFVSNAEQWAKVEPIRDQLPELERVLSWERLPDANAVEWWEDWLEVGRSLGPDAADARLDAVGRDDLASLLYTSGTTGDPKGVMLSHGNFLSNCESVLRQVAISPEDRTLSFLPLSHSFERTAGHYTVMMAGGEIAYATDLERVAVELKEIRPTLVMGVPRFYEKMKARVTTTIERSPYWRRKLFRVAMRVGQRVFGLRQRGEELPSGTKLRWELAQRLVFSKLRARIGGQVRVLVSGGAPLDATVSEFFNHAGLCLVEGYGLTETSPVVACNTPEQNRPGTVGRVIPGVEVEIAGDGEILVRGPSVMQGYWRQERATREVLEEDGTFHTGDIGSLDDGFLRITDRKKELIVTAGGKNVSPAMVEGLIKRSPAVADLCLVGDRRSFLVALLVPDFTFLKTIAAEAGLDWTGRTSMLESPVLRALFQQAIEDANEQLSPPERVRRFALLSEPFSQDNRQLTPTLKVRRRVIEDHYQGLIEELYRPEPRGPTSTPILQTA